MVTRIIELGTIVWAAMSLYYLLFTDYTVTQSWIGLITVSAATGILTHRMMNEKEEDS